MNLQLLSYAPLFALAARDADNPVSARAKSAGSWVWASIVLARASQSSDQQKRQAPNQLSSCPARADVGQLQFNFQLSHLAHWHLGCHAGGKPVTTSGRSVLRFPRRPR